MKLFTKTLLLSAAFGVLTTAHDAQAFSQLSLMEADHNSALVYVANDSKAAEDFVKNLAKDAIAFLGDASLSEAEKEARFRKLLNNGFDMNTISRFALGRYWRTASQEQRKEYQSLFRDMVIEVYSRRFSEYDGQVLEVRDSRKDNDKDVTVKSFIVPETGSEVQVDWRLRYKNGQYKVIDVMVEGVSMALTQRSDFSSVIQRGGGEIAVLIDHLKQQ